MTNRKKEELKNKSKDELIEIISHYRSMYFFVSETCVDESKRDIDSDKAIKDIRDYLFKHQYDLY